MTTPPVGNREVVPGGAGQGGAGHIFVRAVGEWAELILKTENQRGCPPF